MLRRRDALLIPFSIAWTGFAVFWETGVLTIGAPPFFTLIGALFVLVGTYILFGRFIHDAWRRHGVLYGLTDARILIIGRSELKSIDLASCGEMRLIRHGDDRGTITIGPEASIFAASKGIGVWTGTPSIPTFESIARAPLVFAEIRRLQKTARETYRVSDA